MLSDVVRTAALLLLCVLICDSTEACQIYRISRILDDPAEEMNARDFTFRGRIISLTRLTVAERQLRTLEQEHGQERAELYRKMLERKSVLVFKVDRVWKGQVSEDFFALYTDVPCALSPVEGDKYIVFGNVDKDGENIVYGFVPERGFGKVEPRLDRGY